MIINHLNVRGAGSAFSPFEAYPPLVVNPYAVLPPPISLQDFKMIAGQHGQVANGDSGLEAIQFQASRSLDAGERLHSPTQRKVSSPLVAVAEDHTPVYDELCVT